MKSPASAKVYLLLFLCFITLILFTGCSEKTEEPILPPTFNPSEAELANSAFFAFTSKLDSIPVAGRGGAVRELLNLYPLSPVIEDSSLACFFWYGKADTVMIQGDIQMAWGRTHHEGHKLW
ncbi:MAG: hypothetical protein IPN18_14720 [Ignavibacteriales bacterium]|nr:hypothetical protein [Ignavibacteriales bacterium]